jgi:HEPN domain-containing protein
MSTKAELLAKFARERLTEIAHEFNVVVPSHANVEDLVRALGKARRPTKAELEVLLRSAEQSVKGAFVNEASEFYSRTAIRGFEHHDALLVHVARSIALAEIVTPGVLDILDRHLAGLRGVDLPTKEKMPKHIVATLSHKQWSGLRVAKSFQWVWTTDGSEVLRLAREDPDLISFQRLSAAPIPDPGKRYLCLAWKSYASEQYDASVVMLGRAVEFLLKSWLQSNASVRSLENATLGTLIREYEKVKGNKHEVAKYVSEVEALERNLSAHDHRPERQAMPEIANHVWTGAVVLLKQLLGVEVRLESIRVAE